MESTLAAASGATSRRSAGVSTLPFVFIGVIGKADNPLAKVIVLSSQLPFGLRAKGELRKRPVGDVLARPVGRAPQLLPGGFRSVFLTLLAVAGPRICRLERPQALVGNEPSRVFLETGFGRGCGPEGVAMLIRSDMVGVSGGVAVAAGPDAIPAALRSNLLLGGLLLLICP